MQQNIEIAHKLGYLKIKPGVHIESKEAKRYPDSKVVICGTGAQGQERAFLMRYAQDEHRIHTLKTNDTIVFSSSVIPGNERTVQNLKDTLCRKGANVVHTQMLDIHAGGHGKAEDAKILMRLVRPKFLIPCHGTYFKRRANAKLGLEVGIPKENIVMLENGNILELTANKHHTMKKKVPTDYIFVDGLGIDDVNHVVLRDRQMMSEDGMFIVIATVSKKTGELISSPDIISRGFVYMKESKKLIEQTRTKVKKILKDGDKDSGSDETYLKSKIRNEIGQFLYAKTKRRPMVLPVVIEV